MISKWDYEELPSIEEINKRLKMIFPREVDVNGYISREMGAKTVFCMLYGYCVGENAWIRPASITCMTDEQAKKHRKVQREEWLQNIQSSNAPRDIPKRWYKPNTREPIRDETIREMVRLNAVNERRGLPTTSPLPRYALNESFAQLFNPELHDLDLKQAITAWQRQYLSKNALARIAIMTKTYNDSGAAGILIHLPNGETRRVANGPSNLLAKAVVEQFTQHFMNEPAVILISESAKKLLHCDEQLCQAIGFHIDVKTILPDLILADLGGNSTKLVFVECVASDGPINDRRKEELIYLAETAGFDKTSCVFLTVFRDRASGVSRKLLSSIAWGTFVWYESEPKNLIYLREAGEQKNLMDLYI